MPSDRVPEVDEDAAGQGGCHASAQMALRDLQRGVAKHTRLLRESRDAREQQVEQRCESDKALLLELVDMLDRLDGWLNTDESESAKSDPSAGKWVSRLHLMSRLVSKSLAKRRVAPLDLLTAPAGAVMVIDRVPSPDATEESVLEVVQRGWLWKGELLRRASVIVSTPMDPRGCEPVTEEPPHGEV